MHSRSLSKLLALALSASAFFFAGATQAATTASVQMTVPGKGNTAATAFSVSEAQGSFLLPVTISAPLTGVSGTVVIATKDFTAASGTNYGVSGAPYVSGSLIATASTTWTPVTYSGTYVLTWASGDPVTKYVSIPIIDSGVNNASTVQFQALLVSGTLLTRTGLGANNYQQTPYGTITGGVPALTPSTTGTFATVSILGAHATTTAGIKLHNSSYIIREPFASSTGVTVVPVQIDLARAGDLTGQLSVDFTTAPGTATAVGTGGTAANYITTRGTLIWSGSSLSGTINTGGSNTAISGTVPLTSSTVSYTINVPIVRNPGVPASTPQFTFVLNNPKGGVVTRRTATIRVLDVDALIPAVEFGSQEFYFPQPTTGVSNPTIPVYRSGSAAAAFTISSADGSAIAPIDYVAVNTAGSMASGTAAGTEKALVTLALNSGSTTIQPLYFTLSLGASGSSILGDYSQATVYIVTAPSVNQASVQFSSPTYLVSQSPDSTNTMQLLVQRSGNLAQTTNVNYLTVPGSAQAGVDYLTTFGTLVFNPGEVSKPIDVTINPSSAITGPLQFSVALSNVLTTSGSASGTSALGANGTTIVTIAPYPQNNVVAFVSGSYATPQGTNAQIGVQLDRGALDATGTSAADVTVQVYTRPGTAAAGTDPNIADFVPIPSTSPLQLLFRGGATPDTFLSFPVQILKRPFPVSSRSFNAVLTNPTNAILGSQDTAEIDIDSTVLGTVQFTTTEYLVNEGDGTINLNVGLVRSGSGTVTVPFVLVPGTASTARYQLPNNGGYGGTVTFPPGVSQTQITVQIIDDNIVQPPQTFGVELRPVTGGTVTLGAQSSAQVTITDNDGDNTVEFDAAVYGQGEPSLTASSALVPVRLRATRNGGMNVPLAVDYEIVPGTAVAGTDYQWDPAAVHTVTFAPGDNVADISIRILNDGESGGTKTFTVNLKTNTTPAGTFTTVGKQSSALFKIFEYDVPVNMVQFMAPEYVVVEGGPALILPIVRNGPYNGADSTVTYATRMTTADANYYGDTAVPNRDFTPSSDQVTFRILKDIFNVIQGQETLKYVTIPIIDNGLTTGDLYFTVWITSAVNVSYGSQLTSRVVIRDAEAGNQVQFSQSEYSFVRSGLTIIGGSIVQDPNGTGTASISVSLNPTGNTSITNAVDYQVTDITAVNGVDYRSSNGTLFFSPKDFLNLAPGSNPTKTIDIPLVVDSLFVGGAKQFRISLINPSSGVYVTPPSSAIVNIIDPYLSSLSTVSISVPPSQSAISASNAGNGAFVITRSGTTSNPLTVNYLVKGSAVPGPIVSNTASAAYDYLTIGNIVSGSAGVVSSGSVTIPAGSQSITIPVIPHLNPTFDLNATVEMQIDAAPENPLFPGKVNYLVAPAKSGTVTVLPTIISGIRVLMSVDKPKPVVGDQVIFTTRIRNTGGTDRNDVILTQTIPTSVTFVSTDWGTLATTATTNGLTVIKVPVGIVPSGTGDGSDTEVVVTTVVQVAAPITFRVISTLGASNLDPYTNDDTAFVQVTTSRLAAKPSVTIYGSGDAYELIPLVAITGQGGGVTYLGQYPGKFTVNRTGDTSVPLVVNYTVAPPNPPANTVAKPGERYDALTGSVTILAGTNSATIAVNPKYSARVTGDQSVSLTVTAASSYTVGVPASATIYVRDAEAASVGVFATTPKASELTPLIGGTVSSTYSKLAPISGCFTVTRRDSNGDPLVSSTALDVTFSLGGSAVTGTDYKVYVGGALLPVKTVNGVVQGTVTIPAWNSATRVEVRPIPNKIVDGTRTVTFSIVDAPAPDTNSTNSLGQVRAYVVSNSQRNALVEIFDKETVYLTQNPIDRTAVMGGKNGYITLNRMGSGLDCGLAVPLTYSGGAVYGVDYRVYYAGVETRTQAVFPKGVVQIRLTLVPIKHAITSNVLPVIITVPSQIYLQTAASTYRGVINIFPK